MMYRTTAWVEPNSARVIIESTTAKASTRRSNVTQLQALKTLLSSQVGVQAANNTTEHNNLLQTLQHS
jgi:hypothetical protein